MPSMSMPDRQQLRKRKERLPDFRHLMRTQRPWLFAALAALVALIPALAAAQPEYTTIGKKGDLDLGRASHFGTTLLQPGRYQVQHVTVDGQDYVVVRQQEKLDVGRHARVYETGAEVARVPCQIVPLDKSARRTVARWTKEADGTVTITEIRIMDESAGHLIAVQPVRSK